MGGGGGGGGGGGQPGLRNMDYTELKFTGSFNIPNRAHLLSEDTIALLI